MDFNTSLRRAIKTGEVSLGQNSTKEKITEGHAKLVVMAENCPDEFKTYLSEQEGLETYRYEGSSRQLGKACGMPFVVSTLAVIDAGESDILSIKST